MITKTGTLLLLAGAVWGCAASAHHDAVLEDALQEREAAFAHLAQAMTAYCAARHPSLEARQACEGDKRLELLHLRLINNEEAADRPSTVPTRPSGWPDWKEEGTFPLIRCERAGGRVICHRLSRALTEAPKRSLP